MLLLGVRLGVPAGDVARSSAGPDLAANSRRSWQGDNMASIRGAQQDGSRWSMLAILSLGIGALTLNWFDVATAFPLIGAEFKVGLSSLSFLISAYIVGYGLSHVPGGIIATKLGMKKTLVLGLILQGLSGIMSGLSRSYVELAVFRVLSGIGGSVFIAVAIAAVVVWFSGQGDHARPSVSPAARYSAPEQPWRFTSGYTCNGQQAGTPRLCSRESSS